jgi:RNA polymerase sigma-70 factor (ECF subfamily)
MRAPKPLEGRTDAELLAAAARDNEAFAVFYRRHVERILRFFVARTTEPEHAADLMAETFAAAFISAGRYRAGPEPPIAWLFTIAQNKLIDARRRGKVRNRARLRIGVEPLMLEDSDLMRIDELGQAPDVDELMRELTPDERAAVRARIVDERPYSDIASELQCSPSVVRKRVSRGLTRMRSQLDRAPD